MSRASLPGNGLLAALISASCFSFTVVFARMASFAGVGGATIVFYRVLILLALVSAFAALMRQSLKTAPEERPALVVLGVTTALQGLTYLMSVAFIPAAVAVVVFYTFPILIVLVSPLVERTKLTPPLILIAVIATTGVVLVVGPAWETLDWRGLLLSFGASIATVAQFFAAARCRKTSATAKIFWVNVLVLPSAALIGVLVGQFAPPSIIAAAPLAIVLSIVCYITGFIMQIVALARIAAVAAGIVYCIEPVLATLFSSLILGEILGPLQLLGGALVLGAVIANVLLEQRAQRQAALVPTD